MNCLLTELQENENSGEPGIAITDDDAVNPCGNVLCACSVVTMAWNMCSDSIIIINYQFMFIETEPGYSTRSDIQSHTERECSLYTGERQCATAVCGVWMAWNQ